MDLAECFEIRRILVADGKTGYAGLEGVFNFAFRIADAAGNVFLRKEFFFAGI